VYIYTDTSCEFSFDKFNFFLKDLTMFASLMLYMWKIVSVIFKIISNLKFYTD